MDRQRTTENAAPFTASESRFNLLQIRSGGATQATWYAMDGVIGKYFEMVRQRTNQSSVSHIDAQRWKQVPFCHTNCKIISIRLLHFLFGLDKITMNEKHVMKLTV